MKNLAPYLRFISRTSSLPNKRYTVAYDCRFLYVLSGSGKILIDGGELPLTTDTLLYYPSVKSKFTVINCIGSSELDFR